MSIFAFVMFCNDSFLPINLAETSSKKGNHVLVIDARTPLSECPVTRKFEYDETFTPHRVCASEFLNRAYHAWDRPVPARIRHYGFDMYPATGWCPTIEKHESLHESHFLQMRLKQWFEEYDDVFIITSPVAASKNTALLTASDKTFFVFDREVYASALVMSYLKYSLPMYGKYLPERFCADGVLLLAPNGFGPDSILSRLDKVIDCLKSFDLVIENPDMGVVNNASDLALLSRISGKPIHGLDESDGLVGVQFLNRTEMNKQFENIYETFFTNISSVENA